MKIEDSFCGKGMVTIKCFDKVTNELKKEVTNHNLIVKMGRSELIKLLVRQSAQGITKMAIGSGGANIATDPFNPSDPVDSDTGLLSSKYIASISTTTVDVTASNPSVTFVTLFDCADVNSKVNELGLLFDDESTLFARYTFKTVSLESDTNFYMQVTWKIEF